MLLRCLHLPSTQAGRKRQTTTEHAEKITCWLPGARQGGGVGRGESVITFLGQVRERSFSRRFYTNRHKQREHCWNSGRVSSQKAGSGRTEGHWPKCPDRPPSLPLHPQQQTPVLPERVACQSPGLQAGLYLLLSTDAQVIYVAGQDLLVLSRCQGSRVSSGRLGDRRNGLDYEWSKRVNKPTTMRGYRGSLPRLGHMCPQRSKAALLSSQPCIHTQKVLENHQGNIRKYREHDRKIKHLSLMECHIHVHGFPSFFPLSLVYPSLGVCL